MPPGKPPKLRMMNMETQELMRFQFNPEQLSTGITAVYNKTVIPGMSHGIHQYSHTDNIPLSFDLHMRVTAARSGIKTEAEVELGNQSFSTYATTKQAANQSFSIETVDEKFTLDDRVFAENFLLSLCVPGGGAATVARNAPPRVLVIWPNFLSFEAVMLSVKFQYTRFNRNGNPVELTAACSLEEIRDIRYTSEDIRVSGFYRTSNARAEEP